MSLPSLLAALADTHRVFTRYGENTGENTDIAEYIREVSLPALEVWRGDVASPEPLPAQDIRAALRRVDADTAARLIVDLTTRDLVWHDAFRDPKAAAEAARQSVSLLGNDAVWWSNSGTLPGSWNPVTGCTYDGVIAGVGATHFVIVLQVGED